MQSRQFAPKEATGPIQIIPNRGPHEQIYVSKDLVIGAAIAGLIEYEPEYGPNANVYRPKGEADAETIKGWLAFSCDGYSSTPPTPEVG